MKMKNTLFSIYILFYLVLIALPLPVHASEMGIGVEPTIVDVYLGDDREKTYLPLKLSNPSNQDMEFSLSLEGSIRDYIIWDCENKWHWCEGEKVVVSRETLRQDAKIINLMFERKTDEDALFETAIYVSGKPANADNGMIAVTPRVKIRVIIHQFAGNVDWSQQYEGTQTEAVSDALMTTTTTVPASSDEKVVVVYPDDDAGMISDDIDGVVVQEEVVSAGAGASLITIIGAVLAIIIIAGAGIYLYLNNKTFMFIPLMLVVSSFLSPIAFANLTENIEITVNVTEAVSPPSPPAVEKSVLLLTPILILSGFILFIVKFLLDEFTINKLVIVFGTGISVIAMTGVLVGMIGVI